MNTLAQRKATTRRPVQRLIVLATVAALLLSACNFPGGTTQPSEPTLTVRQPTSGVITTLGEGVKVVAQASDDQGVVRVELWVDGQLVSQNDAPSAAGLKSFNAAFVWTPTTTGDYVMVVKAFDTEERSVSSNEIAVRVEAAAAPTPAATNTPAATATAPPPTAAATATPGPLPEEEPVVTADELVNVRSGPATTYTILGQLDPGDTVRATGRNADSTWWQIAYPDGPDGKAWVFAQYVTPNDAALELPVVAAPPTPTSAPRPTSPPTPIVVASATPTSVPVFRADRTTIAAGECTTIRWDVDGVQAVYFNGEGVAGHASRQVCPGVTTTYTLRVVRATGEQTYSLTITVTGGCAGEPVIGHALSATAYNVPVGTPFSLVWQVTNIRGVWIVADGQEIPEAGTDPDGGLRTREFRYDTPGTHNYKFKLKKCDNTDIIANEINVTVGSPNATPTATVPAPTPTPTRGP